MASGGMVEATTRERSAVVMALGSSLKPQNTIRAWKLVRMGEGFAG